MDPDEQLNAIEDLVDGPRGKDGRLTPAFRNQVIDHFSLRAFVVPRGVALKKRATEFNRLHHVKSWEKDGRTSIVPAGEPRPNERAIYQLIRRDGQTIPALAGLQTCFTRIKGSGDANVRAATDPTRTGTADSCFTIPKLGIKPSFFVPIGRNIQKAREKVGMSRVRLAREIFGNVNDNIFTLLEDGTRRGDPGVTYPFMRTVIQYFDQHDVGDPLFEANPQRFALTLTAREGNDMGAAAS